MDFQKEIVNMFEFIKKYFKKRNKKKFRKSINSLPLKERFSKIHAINYRGNSENISGKGSTVENPYFHFLAWKKIWQTLTGNEIACIHNSSNITKFYITNDSIE
jgi:hypothetical protein